MPACYCAILRRATRAVTNLYDAELAPAGLTVAQYALLNGLERLGPCSITRAAEALGLDRTTLGRNLKPLVGGGLIDLAAEQKDRRERLVRVSAKGRQAISRCRRGWLAAQRRIETRLSRERLGLLERLLGEIESAAVAPPRKRTGHNAQATRHA